MWTPTKNAKYGVAIAMFAGESRKRLALEIGDTVQILEEYGDWYRGFCTKNRQVKGIFPKSYIHVIECKVDVEGPEEAPIPLEDAVVSEITYSLREWGTIWKKKYIEQQMTLHGQVRYMMLDLITLRKQLVSGTLTQELVSHIKDQATVIVDQGNKILGLDLVPRINSEQVDTESISPVDLYHIHHNSMEKARDIRGGESIRRSARTSEKAVSKPRILAYHLYLQYKSFQCNVGEETEIQFALFDAKTNKFYSEKFLVHLTKNGFPKKEEKIDDYSSLFIDLGSKDLNRDTYLVARILRVGSLREGESTKSSSTAYRRPFGCGALHIKDILSGDVDVVEERETEVKIDLCGESDFATLHESMIKKQQSRSILPGGTTATRSRSRARSLAGLSMRQSVLTTPLDVRYAGRVVIALRLLHGDLASVKKAEPILLKSSYITRKMGFSDVIMPGDVRNDLYVTLVKGEFERGNKTAQRNVEVRAVAVDCDGDIIQDCFCCGAGEPSQSEYLSYVYYHNNSPRWLETFKITIPIEIKKCRGSHIRFEFRHCSSTSRLHHGRDRTEKKLFSVGYIKLVTEDGTTVCDGPHELFLYKCEEMKKLRIPSLYTSLPSNTSEINPVFSSPHPNTTFKRNEKESVTIETLLCSTKLTQNADLLGLLRWKDHPDKVDENLEKLMSLDGEEIVKYLQDIMDALFNMFAFDNGNRIPQSQLVFKAIVYIFNILYDPKFEHFQPVMDAYISRHFSAVLVYKDLLVCLKEILDAVTAAITAPSLQEPFQRCFKVLEYIAKCIVQSRLLYQQAFTLTDHEQFAMLLQDIFDNIANVLALESDVIIKTQSVLLESLPKMLVQLSRIHSRLVLSRALCQLINKMPRAMDSTTLLFGVKLRCLKDMINSSFFSCNESKSILLPLCMGQLKRHLVHKQEMTLCATILGDILSNLHRDSTQDVETFDNIQVVISSLLEVVVATTLDMARERTRSKVEIESNGRLLLVACITGMLRLMGEQHYRTLLGSYKDKKPLKEFIGRILQLFSSLIRKNAFSKDWTVMRMVMNNVILVAVQYVSQTMCEKFLRGPDFVSSLWESYFHLAVSFLTQQCLQLEAFSLAKKMRFLQKYGDMRVQMGYEILAMWQNLGEHKLHFVPGMVRPFLEVTLVPETELRKATLPIFFDMMLCEQQARGNFKQVETELLDNLDILVSSHKGDDEYKQLFNTVLLEKVETEASWQEAGGSFVQSVTRLLERLLDYRSVLEGEENTEKRMTCTMNLLNFYKHEVDRQEMYIRYLYKLKELHEQSGNCTEAAFTLLLHGELLDWTNQLLPEELSLPMEYAWKRKERLYCQVISLFDRGKAWEYGIPLCKELAQLYEKKIQYQNLSNILQKQAKFYDQILATLRPEPEYFRVGFFGQSFPLFLRNREFVYRGNSLEKLASFQERLHSEFSNAKILTSTNTPGENILQGNTRYIQICSVRPLPDIIQEFLEPEVPEHVVAFYKYNDVDTFQLDRPFHKGSKDDNNEFKTLHIERVTMCIASKLPGILRWFEIIQKQSTLLAPVQVALDSMERKNSELRLLVTSYRDRQRTDVRQLTMSLNGVIDAAVSGGFTKYQEAFFTEEFSTQPGNCESVARLKGVFLEQLQILEEALEIHNRLVSPDMRELHKRLVELYSHMKRGIRESGSPSMSRLELLLNTPVSGDKRASQISTSSSVSSAYTSTPPGSNRSSGVYSECMSIDAGTPQIECNGFMSESGQGTLKKFSIEIHAKTPSDPTLQARGSTPSLNSAISSISLDSGLGQGQGHRRSRTSPNPQPIGNPAAVRDISKPALPPRKGSLSGYDGGPRENSPLRLTMASERVIPQITPPRQASEPALHSTPTTEVASQIRRIRNNMEQLSAQHESGYRASSPARPFPSRSPRAVTNYQETSTESPEPPPPIPPKRSASNPGDTGFLPHDSVIKSPVGSGHPRGTHSAGQTPTAGAPSVIGSPPPGSRPTPGGRPTPPPSGRPTPPPIPARKGQSIMGSRSDSCS